MARAEVRNRPFSERFILIHLRFDKSLETRSNSACFTMKYGTALALYSGIEWGLNMKNANTKILKITLITLLGLSMIACSRGGDPGTSDFASRGVDTSSTTTNWAQCNLATSSTGTLNTRLAAYREFGVLKYEVMQVKISALPSDYASAGKFIQFFRWQANTSGSIYSDPTPLNFRIYNASTGQLILNTTSRLRWSDVSTLASQMGITDPAEFHNRTTILVDLQDPTAQFDALQTVLYASNGVVADSVNALLPLFAADPAVYATENGAARHPTLQSLHPFKDRMNQGWSGADFESWANQFCSGFTM